MVISHLNRERLGLQNEEIYYRGKKKNTSDKNKTKLGDSNADHSPHPSQENLTTHILLLGPVCFVCLKTLAADNMRPSKFKRHLETLNPTHVRKPHEFFKGSILTTTHTFKKQNKTNDQRYYVAQNRNFSKTRSYFM